MTSRIHVVRAACAAAIVLATAVAGQPSGQGHPQVRAAGALHAAGPAVAADGLIWD
ncbi:hypothetical protein [Streptomyces sp. 1331.2]|uniref:hypothetical protein n=1 Tax=Streptomyces sp. 1331.2 TaxID=1938835 RepID=UPI000BC9BFA3|nr:hypothetical protein [Streptomyces sp. 1331.2]SOB85662.1 hypothetical protein SAMN06272789_5953 [Streptomyces sp. 1331.2]